MLVITFEDKPITVFVISMIIWDILYCFNTGVLNIINFTITRLEKLLKAVLVLALSLVQDNMFKGRPRADSATPRKKREPRGLGAGCRRRLSV